MGPFLSLSPLVSAWTVSSVPAVVTSLENSFLVNLQRGLASTPYLSDETRSGVGNLLRKSRPPRLIADALLISLASDWTKGLESRFGPDSVVSTWHGVERLFEPIHPNCPPPSFPDFEIKKERFINDFGHLDLMSRAFLEVRLSPNCMAESGMSFLAADMAFLDKGLRPLGMYAASSLESALNQEDIIFRFFSPTALELGLYIFLGTSAPKLCLAAGGVPPKIANEVHKFGYHTLGIPVHRRKAHGVWINPLAFAWHDLCHGAYWATHETPYQRIAATLLYDSASRTLNGEKKIVNVEVELGHLLDLELSINGGVAGILEGLRKALPPRRFEALVGDFRKRMGSLSDPLGGTELSEIKDEIAPWLLPQL